MLPRLRQIICGQCQPFGERARGTSVFPTALIAMRPRMRRRTRSESEIADHYAGDDPARLASEIESALAQEGRGIERRTFRALTFFEGELRLILRALRQLGEPR